MKPFYAIALLALATVTSAQSVQIGYPPAGSKVHLGETLTVQIQQPDSIMGSWTLGIGIGIESCASSPCQPPSSIMGSVLYNGPFNPQGHPGQPFHQNFTVTIPTFLAKGPAQLNVAYAALWGAGASPAFDTLSENLNIV